MVDLTRRFDRRPVRRQLRVGRHRELDDLRRALRQPGDPAYDGSERVGRRFIDAEGERTRLARIRRETPRGHANSSAICLPAAYWAHGCNCRQEGVQRCGRSAGSASGALSNKRDWALLAAAMQPMGVVAQSSEAEEARRKTGRPVSVSGECCEQGTSSGKGDCGDGGLCGLLSGLGNREEASLGWARGLQRMNSRRARRTGLPRRASMSRREAALGLVSMNACPLDAIRSSCAVGEKRRILGCGGRRRGDRDASTALPG